MFLCAPQGTFAAGADSCECPQLSCDKECEVEQDLTFYSEKCEGGTKVRSCSRPTCVKIDSAPAKCTQANITHGQPVNVAAGVAPAEPVREVASAKNEQVAIKEQSVVGRIKFIEGVAYRISRLGKEPLSVGDEIREHDRISTESSGRVQVAFNSGNTLNITPDTEVEVSEASDSIPNQDKKRMVLDLIRGRVRNKVNQKYNGETSYYRVRTKAAVAGVRGTDFTISVYEDKNDLVSKIETLEGKVELSDDKMEKKTLIAAGEGGSFVASKSSLFGDKDKAEFLAKGYLTPVYKMTGEQIEALDKETKFASLIEDNARSVASVKNSAHKKDLFICSSPSAKLNQCSWACENNPSGERKCRTDLPQVSCVRRICNANGAWSQPTRLPASYHEACQADSAVVKDCDY